MAGLNKEIWLPEIMEGFYPEASFLTEARDFSAFVENDKINLAEAGVNPNVLINNSTYPVPTSERGDLAISMELDVYDTENTLLRNAEKAEQSYDKMKSIMYGHKQAMLQRFQQKASHAFAPLSNASDTPVIVCTGGDNGSGNKSLKFEDILTLSQRWDDRDFPAEGRILVLSTQHVADLRKQSISQFKEFLKSNELFGFKVYKYSKLPVFNKSTGVKKAFGAAATPATDVIASIAFHKQEVMRADGRVKMFADLDNPKERGDIIGFQKRGLAMPIRNKAISAIYSPAV